MTRHDQYQKSGNGYVPVNTFEIIENVLREGSLENFYPEVVYEFYKTYKTKPKEKIQELNQDYSSKEVIERAANTAYRVWQRISAAGIQKDAKIFAEKIGNLYIRFEKTNDRLWKASNGYDNIEIIQDEKDFLKMISRHVYATAIFEKRENIKEQENRDGTISRPSQRSLKHIVGVLPLAIFDIDEGLSINDAKILLDSKGYSYSIVTTKSHGLGSETSDRFRVFVPLSFGEKFKNFETEGLRFEKEECIRQMQLKEWGFFVVEVARSLGLLEYCDPSALKDAARKYMPSPPVGSENHVSVIDFNKDAFPLQSVIASAKMAKETAEKEALEHRQRLIEKYCSNKDIQKNAQDNPDWKQIYDTDIVLMTDPAEIIYQYEAEGSEHVRTINFGSSNPRIKVSGHEYAVWQPSGGEGFIITDFVSEEKTNLLGYMRNKFPSMSLAERLFKLKTDFKELFGTGLIMDNPYYYLKQFTIALSENNGDFQKANEKLQVGKIAQSMKIEQGKLMVTKMNGYSLWFPIVRGAKGAQIEQGSENFQQYLLAIQKKSSPSADAGKYNQIKREAFLKQKNTI
ncbi:MAG: hypothetical protein PHT07_10010 [Paludibacter sp.]|nr:hypothetical protein [Paludibacter sp.]